MICEECQKRPTDAARGWRAYLMQAANREVGELVFYCPLCAQAEFGPSRRHTAGDDD